tara:strand:+ start:658 stop:789 length:132 start_codon:yes stop_codon:yes gene_type:complete
MSLVANGARPHTKNLAGETAVSDARRERHTHVRMVKVAVLARP